MPTSRPFSETIREQLQKDAAFGPGMLMMAMEFAMDEDLPGAKAVLREYINATIGFVALGEALDRSPKSLMRMLSADGNPYMKNFFEITSFLMKKAGVRATVSHEKFRKPRKAA